MNDLTQAIQVSAKPYDIVKHNKTGDYGVIIEVSLNECQSSLDNQIDYHIEWIDSEITKVAWFNPSEVTVVDNVFKIIAKASSSQSSMVNKLLPF